MVYRTITRKNIEMTPLETIFKVLFLGSANQVLQVLVRNEEAFYIKVLNNFLNFRKVVLSFL